MKNKAEIEAIAKEWASQIPMADAPVFSGFEEAGFIAGYEARGVEDWNAAIEAAATQAFEKIRWDDRTDRWQVANEVAAHIRALKKTGAAS